MRVECLIKHVKSQKVKILLFLYVVLLFGEHFIDYFPYMISQQLEILLAFSLCFFVSTDVKLKSIFLTISLYSAYVLLTDWYLVEVSIYQYLAELLVFFLFAYYQITKNYDIKSDKINANNVYLVFYKPKGFIQFLTSLFGLPVSSAGTIVGDFMYLLKRGKPMICKLNLDEKYIYEKFIVVDTGVKITENHIKACNLLRKQQARQIYSLFLRCNCVRSLKPLLDTLPEFWQYRIMDWLPSIYLMRREKQFSFIKKDII